MVDFFTIDLPQLAVAQSEGADDTVNNALEAALRSGHAIYAKAGVTASVDASVASDDNTSEYRRFLRAALIKFSGTVSGSPTDILYVVPAVEKVFHFHNATNVDVIVKIGTSTGTRVRSGMVLQLYATGSDVIYIGGPNIPAFEEVLSVDSNNDWFLVWDADALALRRCTAGDLGGAPAATGLEYRGALLKKSGNQDIVTGAVVWLTWQQAQYDTDSLFQSVGSPGNGIVIPSGVSKVQFEVGLYWDQPASTTRREMYLAKNGLHAFSPGTDHEGLGLATTQTPATANDSAFVMMSGVHQCVPGDIFEVVVFQNSGGTRRVDANEATYFACEIIE